MTDNSESQLRQDLVSGDWIIMAPGRGSYQLKDQIKNKKKVKRKKTSLKECPWGKLKKSGEDGVIFVYPSLTSKKEGEWELQIVPNKYPAVSHEKIQAVLAKHGPYSVLPGVGHHDIVITRDHYKNFSALNEAQANLVFRSFRDRYLMFLNDEYLAYVAIYHNWGPEAGASVSHPHYQMIAIPVVPPDIQHSLLGSSSFFKKHNKCVHCVITEWELKERKRVIYENKGAVAFVPFVSRVPFEVRVFPKTHLPYLENTLDEDMSYVVSALQKALKKIEKNLGDPDYNFFIHTAPIQYKETYSHYHWHIEVWPKVITRAGFELGTGVEINVVDPDEAAGILNEEIKLSKQR